jgi:hypothetical protein
MLNFVVFYDIIKKENATDISVCGNDEIHVPIKRRKLI